MRVLHQANAGVSAARNRALEIASGAFITFVDADDTTDPTYLERLYTGMQDTGADIASVNWLDTNGRNAYDTALAGADGVRLYTQDEVGDMHLLGSCCGRMFRRASLVQLFLDEDLFYGEDTLFSVCNFYGSKGMRLLVLGACLYRYTRARPGTATSQPFNERRLSQMKAYHRIREIVKEHPAMLESVTSMQAFAFWNLYRMLLRSGREREFPAEAKELRRTIQESRQYLLGGQGLRQRIMFRLYLTCGRLATWIDSRR